MTHMTRNIGNAVAVAAVVMLIGGCGGPTRGVKREAAGGGVELSGKWSSVDAKEVSDALIKQALEGGWLSAFVNEEGRKPRVRVRSIVNKTREHIDAQVFIKNIEKAMINSGKVSVLAQEGAELDAINRAEDYAMDGRVDEGPSVGSQLGEDFVVMVRMASIVDQVAGEQVRFYKINFEMQNATTAEKVWIGDHEIQKRITQKRVTW